MEKDYLKEIKAKINANTIPEIGNFEPVAAELKLENDERLAFCVAPLKDSIKTKKLSISHAGPNMMVSSKFRIFSDKAELLKYMDSLENFDIENIISKMRELKKL